VPAGLIKLKKEFLALKQGSMTVYEYCDRFTQLSQYCPDEDERDEDKQDHFLEGLNDGLSYMTSNVKYANFLEMVDRALVLERKRRKMEEKKRKFNSSQQQGSSSRPRYNRVPSLTLFISLATKGSNKGTTIVRDNR
jgi:hypothetical protein